MCELFEKPAQISCETFFNQCIADRRYKDNQNQTQNSNRDSHGGVILQTVNLAVDEHKRIVMEQEYGKTTSIKTSGCGLCSALMVGDYLLPNFEFTLEEAIELSYEAKANMGAGMKIRTWMRPYLKYVLPVIIFALLVYSIVVKFI